MLSPLDEIDRNRASGFELVDLLFRFLEGFFSPSPRAPLFFLLLVTLGTKVELLTPPWAIGMIGQPDAAMGAIVFVAGSNPSLNCAEY